MSYPPAMSESAPSMYSVTLEVPAHLRDWQLPPGWCWGADGLNTQHRHYQEVIDALGRSLSLVSAPDPVHHDWLEAEARHLAHRNHPAMPTTYHYWASFSESRRGPGYLRRWIAGETVGARLRRMGNGRRTRRAARAARDRLGAQLPPRPGHRARRDVARHRVDHADGPALDHRMAVGHAARRDPRRHRARHAPHADSARVVARKVDADAAHRSVAAGRDLLRDAHRRERRRRTKFRRCS